ncbi:MAG: hypothetical protein M8467_17780 [Anaerolineae bacterium]|nr:hypothetical protein [Anaerolineae bacterium]
MAQRTRVLIAVLALVILIGAIVGVEALRRSSSGQAEGASGEPTLAPGSIPIYVDGRLEGSFSPTDLEALEQVSFVDAEEGKTQEGWLLRDVLLLHVDQDQMQPEDTVVVTSGSRGKSAELTWAEVDDAANWVMFDLSGRSTLKLVSVLERLDVRDEWIQDVDRIEITSE